MHGVMDGMEPLFCDVGALALTPSNADRGAEEGAEGEAAAADANRDFPSGGRPVGLTASHLNLFKETLERMGRGQGGGVMVPAGGDRGLGRAESCASAVA